MNSEYLINIWEYFEERAYINQPKTLEELEDNIRREVRDFQECTIHILLRSVMHNSTVEVGPTREKLLQESVGIFLELALFGSISTAQQCSCKTSLVYCCCGALFEIYHRQHLVHLNLMNFSLLLMTMHVLTIYPKCFNNCLIKNKY